MTKKEVAKEVKKILSYNNDDMKNIYKEILYEKFIALVANGKDELADIAKEVIKVAD